MRTAMILVLSSALAACSNSPPRRPPRPRLPPAIRPRRRPPRRSLDSIGLFGDSAHASGQVAVSFWYHGAELTAQYSATLASIRHSRLVRS